MLKSHREPIGTPFRMGFVAVLLPCRSPRRCSRHLTTSVAVSITETVPEILFTTQACFRSRVTEEVVPTYIGRSLSGV